MFDIERLNLLLAAASLPTAEDIAPKLHGDIATAMSNLSPQSTMAHGLTALETKFGMNGVDEYRKQRRHVTGDVMLTGERLRYMMRFMRQHGLLPEALAADLAKIEEQTS